MRRKEIPLDIKIKTGVCAIAGLGGVGGTVLLLRGCGTRENLYPEIGDTGTATANLNAIIDYNQIAYYKDACEIQVGDTLYVLDKSYLRGVPELRDSLVYNVTTTDGDCTGWVTHRQSRESIKWNNK